MDWQKISNSKFQQSNSLKKKTHLYMHVWDTASPAWQHTVCLTAPDERPDISECARPFQIKFAGEAQHKCSSLHRPRSVTLDGNTRRRQDTRRLWREEVEGEWKAVLSRLFRALFHRVITRPRRSVVRALLIAGLARFGDAWAGPRWVATPPRVSRGL